MHQNLAERADLPQQQKLVALYELAQDYLKAGLLVRAEGGHDEVVAHEEPGGYFAPARVTQAKVRPWLSVFLLG